MASMDVAGARIVYEVYGDGPPLIMIPGATGTAHSFRIVASYLSQQYTVITYDRRGFSRSQLTEDQDYSRRLESDAGDVRMLIDRIGGEPAIVFGASAGGIVALDVMARHPDCVRALVPLEPPAMRYLSGGQETLNFLLGVYELYRRVGVEPALKQWREGFFAFTPHEAKVMARAQALTCSERNYADVEYWFEHELRQYPAVELDLDALMAHADRIVLAVGREASGYPAHEVTVSLCEKLGLELTDLPGGHSGYLTEPAKFATELMGAIANR